MNKHILRKKSEHYHTFAYVSSHSCHRKTNNYLHLIHKCTPHLHLIQNWETILELLPKGQ